MKSSRSHTEIPILIASHFQPFVETDRGSATIRSAARLSSIKDARLPFISTHARTTDLETVRSRPAPLGRLIIANVRRLLAAPPVKTHP